MALNIPTTFCPTCGAVPRPGLSTKASFQGILTIDFGKLSGWNGLTLFSNFFQIHNTGRIRRDLVGGINTIAAIEAVPTTRLSEVWLEQKFAGDKMSLKVGQIAVDTEFFYSDASQMFLQSDWPTIAAVNLPSGGAAYPLATPGVRLRVDPVKDVTLQLEVLDGDPSGAGFAPVEQVLNRYGLNFRVNDPPFVIGEAQFRRNADKKDEGLAPRSSSAAGAMSGSFNDQRVGIGGSLLADPSGSGVAIQHRGNNGLYAVIDQQILPAERRRRPKRHHGIQPHVAQSFRSQPDRSVHRRRHRVRRSDLAQA